jgi:lipopolysaccharide/colanic/teichoic acid biosynthesis glycosyltransferase
MKRFVDISLSLLALLLLAPLSLLVMLLLRLESPAPVLRRSHRVGRNGRMVKVWEFRTAIADPDAMETVGGCQGEEVTRLGAVLRRTGIAQWPLLLNVLRGDFSLVGPRVELPRYVGCYPGDIRKRVLSVKPGLFDLATIQFDEESQLLANLTGEDLEQAYVEKVLPLRLNYAQSYLEQCNFWLDLRILILSVGRALYR